jgi:DNA-binding protein HU-beta
MGENGERWYFRFQLPSPADARERQRSTIESGESMNKADLVDRIAGACSVSKSQATTAIDTTVDSITAALRKGDRVALIGFGTFSVSQRKARNGRNPQTGATIKIAARRVAKFTPGNELKKVVNKGK